MTLSPTPSTSNRFEEQADQSNNNTWGAAHLNPTIQLIDDSLDGLTVVNLEGHAAGSVVLTAINYATDQSRKRTLQFTGAPAGAITIVVPHVSKWYWTINETPGNITVSDGTNSVVVPPGTWAILNTLTEFLLAQSAAQKGDTVKRVTTPYAAVLTDAYSILVMAAAGTIDLSVFASAGNGEYVKVRSVVGIVTVTFPGGTFSTATMQPYACVTFTSDGAGSMIWSDETDNIAFA